MSFGLWGLSNFGIGFQYFWPGSPGIQQAFILLTLTIIPLSFFEFSKHFLNMKENSKSLYIIITSAEFIFIPLYSAYFFTEFPQLNIISIIILVLINLILIIYSTVHSLRGDRASVFYLLSFLGLVFKHDTSPFLPFIHHIT